MNGEELTRAQISTREILTVIFRRKVPIVLCAVLVAAAALTAASRARSVYQATAKVLLRRMGPTALATTWTPFYGLEEEMNTEVEIVNTASVLGRAVEILREKGVYIHEEVGDSVVTRAPTIDDLAGGLSAEPVEMSNIILIRFRGQDPEFVGEAANALAQAYVEHRLQVRRTSGILDYFEDQLRQVEERLIELKEEELALRKQGEIYDLEWQQRVAIRNKGELELKLQEARSKRIAEERKLAAMKRRLEEDPDLLLPFPEIAGDRLIIDMLTQYWNLRAQRDEKASLFTDDNPQVKMLDERLERMRLRFREEIQRRIKEKEFLIEDLRAEEAGYQKAIKDILTELRTTPEVVVQIEHLQKEIAYTYKHYDQLLEKMLETMVSEASDTRLSNAKVISPATVELTKAGKMKTVYVAFSILLGITLGVGFGFLLENMDHSVKSPDDVEDVLGVPVLGSIPDSRAVPDITRRLNGLRSK